MAGVAFTVIFSSLTCLQLGWDAACLCSPPFSIEVRGGLGHAAIPAFPRLQGKELEVWHFPDSDRPPIPTFPRPRGKELEVLRFHSLWGKELEVLRFHSLWGKELEVLSFRDSMF